MASLKSFLPTLGRHLGIPAESLYERQRMLVRLNILPLTEGRGPGSGVRLNGETAGLMLLSALASDNWAAVTHSVRHAASARAVEELPSEVTKKTVGGVVTEILEREEIAAKVSALMLYRANMNFAVDWTADSGLSSTLFNSGLSTSSPIMLYARIHGETVRAIARSMREHRFPSQTSLLRTEPFREVERSNRQKKGKPR